MSYVLLFVSPYDLVRLTRTNKGFSNAKKLMRDILDLRAHVYNYAPLQSYDLKAHMRMDGVMLRALDKEGHSRPNIVFLRRLHDIPRLREATIGREDNALGILNQFVSRQHLRVTLPRIDTGRDAFFLTCLGINRCEVFLHDGFDSHSIDGSFLMETNDFLDLVCDDDDLCDTRYMVAHVPDKLPTTAVVIRM